MAYCEMVWVDPLYSRSAVRRAGAAFIDPVSDPIAREEARIIINNRRSAHGFPLNSMQMVLRHRAARVDPDATVAQRIKRLPSITQKLIRFPSMDLDRMQDIGGCRAVVDDLGRLSDLSALYRGAEAVTSWLGPMTTYGRSQKTPGTVDCTWSMGTRGRRSRTKSEDRDSDEDAASARLGYRTRNRRHLHGPSPQSQ